METSKTIIRGAGPWNDPSGQSSEKNLESVPWGFVLVRCTYGDEALWSSFRLALKKINPLNDELARSLPWTVIEDRDNLANATMVQACLAFQDWVDTTGKHEIKDYGDTYKCRQCYFFHVNDESIESVINPERASEKTGNFLVLVDAYKHLEYRGLKEDDFRDQFNLEQDIRDVLADFPDDSWKLVVASEFKETYLEFLDEGDPWFADMSIDEFQGAPHVYSTKTMGLGPMDHNILYPDKVGFDAYLMLKQFYGQQNLRCVCFEAEEAQTGLQRICGYAGGYRKEEFTYPWYL